MKKLLFILSVMFLYGCTCIGQVPTQYVYVDENCNAALPDYSGMVVVSDNCSIVTLTQLPIPGTVISTTTSVQLQAMDSSGNSSSISFETVILDTIAPTIQLDPEWVGYTDKEISDMYRTFYGWTQLEMYEANQTVVDWDTIWYGDTAILVDGSELVAKYFHNTIVIPDTIVGSEWWWGYEVASN